MSGRWFHLISVSVLALLAFPGAASATSEELRDQMMEQQRQRQEQQRQQEQARREEQEKQNAELMDRLQEQRQQQQQEQRQKEEEQRRQAEDRYRERLEEQQRQAEDQRKQAEEERHQQQEEQRQQAVEERQRQAEEQRRQAEEERRQQQEEQRRQQDDRERQSKEDANKKYEDMLTSSGFVQSSSDNAPPDPGANHPGAGMTGNAPPASRPSDPVQEATAVPKTSIIINTPSQQDVSKTNPGPLDQFGLGHSPWNDMEALIPLAGDIVGTGSALLIEEGYGPTAIGQMTQLPLQAITATYNGDMFGYKFKHEHNPVALGGHIHMGIEYGSNGTANLTSGGFSLHTDQNIVVDGSLPGGAITPEHGWFDIPMELNGWDGSGSMTGAFYGKNGQVPSDIAGTWTIGGPDIDMVGGFRVKQGGN